MYAVHVDGVRCSSLVRRRVVMAAKRSVVVTGASTGIGCATAKVLLGRGFEVFGSVRKRSDADRLEKHFGADFTRLQRDVSDPGSVAQEAEQVGAALVQQRLAGLMNNACFAVSKPLQ